MKKLLSIIATVAFCFTANSQNYSDLIISKYFEGANNSKALEIYNGTGASVDLSAYSVMKEVNGAGGLKDPVNLSGTLANGATFVLFNDNDNNYLIPLYTADLLENSKVMNFNGNDAIGLIKNSAVIDLIGNLGDNKDWGKDVFMERKCSVTAPNTTYTLDEWDVEQTTDVNYVAPKLGTHCSADIVPPVIQSATAVNDTTVRVTFNKNVTSATASVVSNYSIDNGVTVSAATVVNSKVVTLTTSTLVAGTTYTVTASGIADEAGNTATSISKEFTVISATEITDLAELWFVFFADIDGDSNGSWNADTTVFTGTKIYKITGPVAVTALGSQRNQKWVQDYSASNEGYEYGVLIDDPNSKLTSEIEVGNTLTGLVGTLTYYNDLIEFVPVADVAPDATPAFTVEPFEVNLDEFSDEEGQEILWSYQSCLVTLSNVYFKDNVTLKNGSNYAMCSVPNGSDNDIVDSAVRVHIYNVVTYTTNKERAVNVTGVLVIDKFGMMRVSPRSTADIEGDYVSNENIVLRSKNSALRLSPVPVKDELTVTMNDATSVDVYSLNGTLVAEKRGVSGSTKINVASLAHGTYFVKATNKAGKTYVKKFIKK